MSLGLVESLPALVEAKFLSAKAAQGLTFSSTELAIIRSTSGIPFQLRYCPALAKKPAKDPECDKPPEKKRFDPFENPTEDLLIASVPTTNPSHLLVLNKFPVIQDHFIIATKGNKPQTNLLEADDLGATYACMKAWEEGQANNRQNRLFAFFNSGAHSGASQPHRHLQFLPVERMAQQETEPSAWTLLVDSMSKESANSTFLTNPSLPFTHYALPIPESPSHSDLHTLYNRLYAAASRSVQTYNASHSNSIEPEPTSSEARISYNLALTTSTMMICPRRTEGESITREDGSEVGFVALNGTILAGTLMVKGEEEWDVLKKDPGWLDRVLERIGIPWEDGAKL